MVSAWSLPSLGSSYPSDIGGQQVLASGGELFDQKLKNPGSYGFAKLEIDVCRKQLSSKIVAVLELLLNLVSAWCTLNLQVSAYRGRPWSISDNLTTESKLDSP